MQTEFGFNYPQLIVSDTAITTHCSVISEVGKFKSVGKKLICTLGKAENAQIRPQNCVKYM